MMPIDSFQDQDRLFKVILDKIGKGLLAKENVSINVWLAYLVGVLRASTFACIQFRLKKVENVTFDFIVV